MGMASVVIDSMSDMATIIVIGMPCAVSILKKLVLTKTKTKKKKKQNSAPSLWLVSSFNS